jgi:hypothetical protein
MSLKTKTTLMHLYLALQLLALNYYVKVVGYYYPIMLN